MLLLVARCTSTEEAPPTGGLRISLSVGATVCVSKMLSESVESTAVPYYQPNAR